MKLGTFVNLARGGQLRALLALQRLLVPFHRLAFDAGLVGSGAAAVLGRGPATLARIAEELAIPASALPGLEAWLDSGIAGGELRRTGEEYVLHGALARLLGDDPGGPLAAMVEEAAGLHHALLTTAPLRLREGRPFTLADQRGELVARSSRLIEPFLREAVERFVPPRGAVRLLEIGCGSGVYMAHAARRNAELSAVGLELQAEVAEAARRNLAEWGLAGRTTVENIDVRARPPEPAFDLVTLHNNIYYFPVGERVALLALVSGSLRPGGRILLSTACRGGGVGTQILDLWGAVTEGCGRLPTVAELLAQLAEAGFTEGRAESLIPGESFHAFTARWPGR